MSPVQVKSVWSDAQSVPINRNERTELSPKSTR